MKKLILVATLLIACCCHAQKKQNYTTNEVYKYLQDIITKNGNGETRSSLLAYQGYKFIKIGSFSIGTETDYTYYSYVELETGHVKALLCEKYGSNRGNSKNYVYTIIPINNILLEASYLGAKKLWRKKDLIEFDLALRHFFVNAKIQEITNNVSD